MAIFESGPKILQIINYKFKFDKNLDIGAITTEEYFQDA
jgi:hypothetical protein